MNCCVHRYINFTFNEAGGACQNTGTLAKFGQKTGTFSYFDKFSPKNDLILHVLLNILTDLQI